MDWDGWLYQAGPLNITDLNFETNQSHQAQNLAELYIELEGQRSPDGYKNFSSFEEADKLIFLDKLRESWGQINIDTMVRLDEDLNLTSSADPKIK